MRHKSFKANLCPVARSLDTIGEWWSLLIVRDALTGTRRFSDFQKSLGLAKNVLSTRLKKLVACGILEQVPASDGSAYREYALTPKGRELFPVIVALRQWGETSSGSGQTHRKALSSPSTQRERENPYGERSGTGYCQKLNARLRRHERRLHVSHGLLAIVLPASESALNAISRMSMATRTGFRIFCLLPSGA